MRMSMISAQIDELRQMADGQATYRDATAVMLRAADTIWELRDDLKRANDAVRDAEHDESRAWDRVRKAEAEADRLRNELDAVGIAAYLYGRGDLKAENAKLRELVQDLAICACGKYCYGCPHQYDGCDRDQRLRELGVEVDE